MKTIDIKVAIQKAFQRIGTSNGHAPPDSPLNNFPQAFEFFVASNLRSIANTRYDAAKKAAAASGVLGDESSFVEGTTTCVHSNEYFDIAAKKASSTTMLDRTIMSNHLARKGWKPDEVEAFIDECSKPRKGAVTYEVILKA